MKNMSPAIAANAAGSTPAFLGTLMRVPMTSVHRIKAMFAQDDLFAEIEEDPENKPGFEGAANDALDTQLRASNCKLDHLTDDKITDIFAEMHRVVLWENLSFLQSEDPKPYVLVEKAQILQWVFSTDVIKGRPATAIPFSFVNCCIAEGVDPDKLRTDLLQMVDIRALMSVLMSVSRMPRLRKKVMYADIVGAELATGDGHGTHQFAGA
jgi:hypothetical protein